MGARVHMTGRAMDPLPAVAVGSAAEAEADEEADPPATGTAVEGAGPVLGALSRRSHLGHFSAEPRGHLCGYTWRTRSGTGPCPVSRAVSLGSLVPKTATLAVLSARVSVWPGQELAETRRCAPASSRCQADAVLGVRCPGPLRGGQIGGCLRREVEDRVSFAGLRYWVFPGRKGGSVAVTLGFRHLCGAPSVCRPVLQSESFFPVTCVCAKGSM